MKTLARALLVAVLFPIALSLVLSTSLTRFLHQERLLPVLGLIALAGILADSLAFILVPEKRVWWRRLLHVLGVAGVFLVGFYVLGAVTWTDGEVPQPGQPQSALLDLSVSLPFVIAVTIGFFGYLLVSLLIRPERLLPRRLRKHLATGEKVLCWIQQTRWKHPITPDTLMATNVHLVVYKPTNLGLYYNIEDYQYIDIANMRSSNGVLFSTLFVKERFEGEDLEFRDMPKRASGQFVRIVTEEIEKRRSEVPLQPQKPPNGSDRGVSR